MYSRTHATTVAPPAVVLPACTMNVLHFPTGLLETAAPVLPSCSFAALTASSRLRVLNISKAHIPPAAWQHKFPQAPQQQQRHQQRLSHLTHVTLTDVEVGPEAVAALVRCCPRLQHLSLTCCCGSATGMENRSSSDSESNNSHSMRREGDGCHQLPMLIQQQHPQLLPLLGLSCLTSLSLSSFNSGAAEIVAKISNLQHLRFYSDQTLPTSWLQPRMALTGLQLLSARSWSRLGGNSNAVVSDSSQDEKVQEALAPLVFINKVSFVASHVWFCAPAVVRRLGRARRSVSAVHLHCPWSQARLNTLPLRPSCLPVSHVSHCALRVPACAEPCMCRLPTARHQTCGSSCSHAVRKLASCQNHLLLPTMEAERLAAALTMAAAATAAAVSRATTAKVHALCRGRCST